ncbi:hypothetical protein E4U57_007398 [Claviceps arundinis]|uniref:Uncharacterized protein n=1 Tax=Claviceps arundinis TaxID=1623583 RepID=A0ABQ7PF63_9HYPO|nr:hypothetical protein E4U57_007398 [Claviceps arundinis]
MFLIGLREQMIANPLAIWDRYKDHFCDDLPRRLENRDTFLSDLQDPVWYYGLYLLAEGLDDKQLPLAQFCLLATTCDLGLDHNARRVVRSRRD